MDDEIGKHVDALRKSDVPVKAVADAVVDENRVDSERFVVGADARHDISDFFDNDIVHIVKGLLSDKNVERGSCISSSQFRGIILSHVHNDYENGLFVVNNVMDIIKRINKYVLLYSMSINGVGIDVVVDAVQNRLAVNDIIRQKSKDKMDMEEH